MMSLLRHGPQPTEEDDLFLHGNSTNGAVPTTPTATVATFAPTADAASKETDRPFQCGEPGCGRRFNRKFTLSEHMKTHTGEKPYVCPAVACAKRFSTSGNLARHKRLHASIKPFECSIDGCKRSFPNELKLQQHLKIHLGGKTHMCKAPGCGKSFSTAGNLTRHMKNHHHGAFSSSGSNHGDHHGDLHYYQHTGSMSVLHHPHDVHSPVSVANTAAMGGDQYSAYSQATHVPLTSYASLSSQTPPPMGYSHGLTSQPSMANLYYSFNQSDSMSMAPAHVPRGPAVYAHASYTHQQPPMYDELQPMPAMGVTHDGHPQNLFDDVIQFQLAHPRMV